MAGTKHGTQYLTTSGTVGIANTPKTVYAIHIISGATASVAILNNVGVGGTIYVNETGVVGKGQTFNYSEGFYFPGGCYYTADGNQTSVLISYEEFQ